MKNIKTYRGAACACCIGCICQAVAANLTPLFFVIFSEIYNLSVSDLAVIVLCGFMAQMVSDTFAGMFCDKIGAKFSGIIAHVFIFTGLILLGILPEFVSDESVYPCLIAAVSVTQTGAGLIEVLVNPLMDSLPRGEHSSAMRFSILHSFCSIGQVMVIIFTSLSLCFIDDKNWTLIPVAWSLLPFINSIFFCMVSFPESGENSEDYGEKQEYAGKGKRGGLILILFIIGCGGAAEQGIAQWISAYAESTLGIFKFAGDLLGPCIFAALMGTSRMLYGIYGKRISLCKAMLFSGSGAALCYIIAGFSGYPILSLTACSFTGFFVGLMCPGAFALASRLFPGGGTKISGMLALFGDIGCAVGPWAVGAVSSVAGLNTGFMFASLYPLFFTAAVLFYFYNYSKKGK